MFSSGGLTYEKLALDMFSLTILGQNYQLRLVYHIHRLVDYFSMYIFIKYK